MDVDGQPIDPEAEHLLVALRADLSPESRDRIEAGLFGRPAPRRSRRRLAGFAAALAGGLAALLLVLSLSGALPFTTSQQSVHADPTCHYVAAKRTVPQAVVVRRADGTTTVGTRPKTVTRFVRRCR